MEFRPFSKTCLPHCRISFSDQYDLLNPSLRLDLPQVRLFFNFNSKHTDWLLVSQFSKQEKKRHVTVQEIPKFHLKICTNKMSSDLAEISCAVRPSGALTACKFWAKSDDFLLIKIFNRKFLVLFFNFIKTSQVWKWKQTEKNKNMNFKKSENKENVLSGADQVKEIDSIAHLDQRRRIFNEVREFLKKASIPTM